MSMSNERASVLDQTIVALRNDGKINGWTSNRLLSNNILSIRDLISKTEKDLISIYSFGEGSLNEVKLILSKLGLSLKDSKEQ